jgi:hypothetical protein
LNTRHCPAGLAERIGSLAFFDGRELRLTSLPLSIQNSGTASTDFSGLVPKEGGRKEEARKSLEACGLGTEMPSR